MQEMGCYVHRYQTLMLRLGADAALPITLFLDSALHVIFL